MAATVLAAQLLAMVCVAQAHLYRDAAAPVNERVADLLAKMSTEEKVAQLMNPFSSAGQPDRRRRRLGRAPLGRALPQQLGRAERAAGGAH